LYLQRLSTVALIYTGYMPQKPHRLEFLDSIRGLAAIAVLLSHSLRMFEWPRLVGRIANYPFINIPFNGGAAVTMFFVLSGYLLSRPYLVPKSPGAALRKMDVPTFYIRRFTRIWMPWFFAFCLSALAQVLVFRSWSTHPPQTDWSLSFWHAPLTLAKAVSQCLFISKNQVVNLVMQDWSLGFELQVSILLPVVIFLHSLRPRWILAVLTIPAFLLDLTGCYFAFMLGILLAAHADHLLKDLKPKPLSAKVGMLLLGIIYYEMPHFDAWLPAHFGYEWANPNVIDLFRSEASAGCVLILLASMSSGRMQATLHLPLLIFLGRISYSVYLLQFIILLCVLPPLFHLVNSWGIHQVIWLLPLNFIVSVGLTVGLSALTYAWVEKPCIDLGHWLSQKMQQRAAKD
jgi:peptidoglycan/LPS O-acetylase OafA/YrhL